MVISCENGVSSWEIHRALGVTQKTALFLDHRIRLILVFLVEIPAPVKIDHFAK